MDCPRCQIAMVRQEIGEVTIDECPQCQGMWFDQGELGAAKDQADPDLNWLDFEIWKHQDRFRAASQPLRCPKDATEMITIDYDQTGIEIDCCPQCRGVWLDKGEFAGIIAALQQEAAGMDVSDYLKASLNEAEELLTGPESFASEWRDFTKVLRLLQYRLFAEKPGLLAALIEGQGGAPIW